MAKKVVFNSDYDLWVGPRQVKAYKKGTEDTLNDDHAEEVLAKGVAEVVEDRTPTKRGNKND